MTRQGNYVTVPGGSVNWTKDFSSSLSDLSRSLLSQGEAEKERARLASAALEDKRRFELGHALAEAASGREDLRFGWEQKAQDLSDQEREWYKNFGSSYDPEAVRAKKAVESGLLEPAELYGPNRAALLAEVPLYAEDIANFYGTEFTNLFGKPMDAANIATHLSGLPSIGALQASEDQRVKDLVETLKLSKDFIKDLEGNLGKKTGTPITNILITPYTEDFKGASFWNGYGLFGTHAKAAHNLGVSVHAALTKEGFTKPEIEVALTEIFDKGRTGPNLDKLGVDITKAMAMGKDAIDAYRSGDLKSTSYGKSFLSEYFNDYVGDLRKQDIKQLNLDTARRSIAALREGFGGSPEEAGTPVEEQVLGNLGLPTPNGGSPSTPGDTRLLDSMLPDITPESAKALDVHAGTPDPETQSTDRGVLDPGERTSPRDLEAVSVEGVVSDTDVERNRDIYQQNTSLVTNVNNLFGENFIPGDTLIIYPFDESGNPRSFEETVELLRAHPLVKGRAVVSKNEYLEAIDDPRLQQSLLNDANRSILSEVLKKVGDIDTSEDKTSSAEERTAYDPSQAEKDLRQRLENAATQEEMQALLPELLAEITEQRNRSIKVREELEQPRVEDNSTYREDGLTIHTGSGSAFSEMSEEQLGALRNGGSPKESEAAAEELIRRSLRAQTSSTPRGLPKVGDVDTVSLDRLPNTDNTVSGGGLARLSSQEVPATSVLSRELTKAPKVYVPDTENLMHEPSSRLYSELTDDMLLRIAALSSNRFEREAAKAELLRRR